MEKVVFGTDGWRAIMADQFTFTNVRYVAQAIAQYLYQAGQEKKSLLIGYDNRFLAEEFAQEVAKVLTANGIKTLLTENPTPTPVVAYAVVQEKMAGAVMLTASHNPPQYNGIKFIPHYGGPALPQITAAIEKELEKVEEVKILSLEEAEEQNLLAWLNPKEDYCLHLKKLLDWETLKKAKLKIAVDPMHGVGSGYTDWLLSEAGCAVTVIRGERDAFFGGSLPEPTEVNLGFLKETMQVLKADLALANDGDADRFGVLDSNGEYLAPNQVLVLLASYLLARGKRGAIVRTVATTHMLDKIAEKYKLELIETPVGFKYIGGTMLEKEVLIGGEESGGLSIIGHIPEKDGILADCLLAEMVAYYGKSLTAILADLYQEFGSFYSERLDIHCAEKEKKRILQLIKEIKIDFVADKRVVKQIAVDGLKVLLEDGTWFLIRPSGTENLIRIYSEASKKEEVKQLQKEVKNILEIK